MICRWNEVVHLKGTVYFGDVTFSKKEAFVAAVMSYLKGKKGLIKGNHDNFANKVWTKKYFEQVTDYIELNYNELPFKIDGRT